MYLFVGPDGDGCFMQKWSLKMWQNSLYKKFKFKLNSVGLFICYTYRVKTKIQEICSNRNHLETK